MFKNSTNQQKGSLLAFIAVVLITPDSLLIRLKFQHKNLKDLDKLRNIFYEISIIDKYTLEEFNINNSFLKYIIMEIQRN